MCTGRSWIEAIDTRAQATQFRLESELSGYKTNLIKESIRMGHHDLADFFYARGDLQVQSLSLSILPLTSECCQSMMLAGS